MSAAPGSWVGYKGGSQRLGLNDAAPPEHDEPFAFSATGLELQLGNPCRALLGYDGQLVAIGQNGTVVVSDPQCPRIVKRFQTRDAITCDPCAGGGVLYTGSRGHITAYSLGTTTLGTPHLRQLWDVAVPGTPIQALTSVGDHLYAVIANGRERELHVIDGHGAAPRKLFAGTNLSWLAADAATERVVFFSEEGGSAFLHRIDPPHGEVSTSRLQITGVSQQPLGLVGTTVFAVFGNDDRLYTIDAISGSVEQALDEDTQSFAVNYAATDWNRDTVRIDSSGVVFMRGGPRDAFNDHDRAVRGSPLIVRDRAAAVAMRDGRILLYDLNRPPTHYLWRLKTHGESEITALASFGTYIAAGNERGAVEVITLGTTGRA